MNNEREKKELITTAKLETALNSNFKDILSETRYWEYKNAVWAEGLHMIEIPFIQLYL